MTAPPPVKRRRAPEDFPPYMNKDEAALYLRVLGFRKATGRTVADLAYTLGKLPRPVLFSRTAYWRKEDIDAMLDNLPIGRIDGHGAA